MGFLLYSMQEPPSHKAVLRITIGRFGDPVKPDTRLPRYGSGLGRASMV
jgi:hypothetical protein